MKDPKSNTYLLRVESGTGVAHSRQSQESVAEISQGSRINAKAISLTARGDGSLNEKGGKRLGNINLTHTDLTSRDEQGKRIEGSHITLTGNELNIQAGESHSQFKGRTQSVGVEAGMAAQVGAQTGVGVYARVGASGGKEEGESKTYHGSRLEAETVILNSQGDTYLIGSQAKGKTINANVGGKFHIESLQDEERFKTTSKGVSIEGEIGFGNNWNLSASANAAKGTSYRKQVNEQAGLFAEEGGYHVNADSVHLKGGAIASANPQASELKTNQLTFEDIKNESSSQAASASLSGNIKESQGSSKLESQRKGGISPGLPMYEQSRDHAITKATLTEGRIILNKDTTPTETTAKALGINTDISQANGQVAQPKDIKATLSEQQQLSAAMGNVKSAVETYTTNRQEAAEQEVRRLEAHRKQALASGDAEALAKVNQAIRTAKEEARDWGTGGQNKRIVDTVTIVITSAIAGKSGTELTTTALSPLINQRIKEATTDKTTGEVDKVTNAIAHAVWGAIESASAGGNIATGAVSAAGAELAAPLLANALYGTDKVSELTEVQKQNIVTLSTLAGAIGSTIIGANGNSAEILSSANQGAEIGKSAVENNFALEVVMNNPQVDWVSESKVKEVVTEAERRAMEEFEKAHPELVKNLKATGDISSFIADFVPFVGDIKSFAEAEDGIDYTLAVVGVVPGSEFITKPLKAAKVSIQKAKAAEKLGNIAEAVKHQQDAVKQIRYVKELEVDSYKNLRIRSEVGDNLDLDHIPSFGALKKSKENELGRKLSPMEEKRLRDEATAIAVPKEVHVNSRTYGGKNTKSQISKDASDLCLAQRCDINKMRKSLIEKGYDPSSVEDAINKIIIRNYDRGIK